MKRLLKWPGGKDRIADLIASNVAQHMTPNGRYVELFAGGAAVFFKLESKRAVLVDICQPLMAFYEAIQRDPDAVYDELERLLTMPLSEESYNKVRSEFNGRDFGVRHAARLLYLNKMGFNGLFRLNKDQEYNVAWGKHEKVPCFPTREEVQRASTLLKRATLYSRDYSTILRATHRGDVVYADPPYCGTYNRYSGGHFTVREQRKLAGMLARAASRGVTIFASNIDCEEVREVYGSWATIDTIPVRHKIGCTADSRKVVEEVLICAQGSLVNPKQLPLFAVG